MKKSLLLIFASLITFFSNAQTSQGWLFVSGGGSFSFGTEKNESPGFITEDRYTRITALPVVGFFVLDGLMVGGTVNYSRVKFTNKDLPDFTQTTSNITFGPIVRYYHSSDFFAHITSGFGSSKDVSDFGQGSSEGVEEKLFNLEGGIGKAIFFNEFVAIEPMIYYSFNRFTNAVATDNFTTASGLGFRLNLSIFLE